MGVRGTATLTPDEARALHRQALVIDSQQPPITAGLVFTDAMRRALVELKAQGRTRGEAAPILEAMAAREIQTSPSARAAYLDLWDRSGVTAACGTFASTGRISEAFERGVRRIAHGRAIIDSLPDHLLLIRTADDVQRAHAEGKHGVIIDFQDTIAFGDDLSRIQVFHDLGLRMVQLTYNLQNLVGDGCTEVPQGGLTWYGREVVRRMNDLRILVDVSHCSEQVGRDALDVSTSPVIVSHSASKAVCYHDRAKTDDFARAVAERGGYFGVVIVPGFIRDRPGATLADFARHVTHLVDVCGIDHVGIGTDKSGSGPSTGSLIEYPASMPAAVSGSFDWVGFREAEHRLTPEYRISGYDNFGDWPNITVALAAAGFDEDALRKLLGMNFLRVFQEVVG